MSIELANRHIDLSRRLLIQANYELDQRGDRLQATEKAYCAVAHAVKAIAEDRQWRHGSHNLRRTIVDLLGHEFRQGDLSALHAVADQLYGNYFEDRLHNWQLRGDIDRVMVLLELLWEMREQGPNPDFVPDPDHLQAIERLQLSEDEAASDPLIDYPPPLPPFAPPVN